MDDQTSASGDENLLDQADREGITVGHTFIGLHGGHDD
jgi:hypothetical protein